MSWINWIIWGSPVAILLVLWGLAIVYVTGWIFWVCVVALTLASLAYALFVALIGTMTIA